MVILVTAADNTERLHGLYEGFNDIRAELENAVTSFELLQEDIRLALEDINEELETVPPPSEVRQNVPQVQQVWP